MSSELFGVLKDFGLTNYEARVLEALLLNGSLNPGEIVTAAGIPQPRVYDIIGKLKEKGMVEESPGKKKVFRARDIEASLGMRVKELTDGIAKIKKVVDETRTSSLSAKPYLWLMENERVIIDEMKERIDNAKDEIIISCTKMRLIKLRSNILKAISRGISVAIVIFPEVDKKLLDEFRGALIKVRSGMSSEVIITDREIAIISIGQTIARRDYAILNDEDEITHITGYFFYHTLWKPAQFFSTPASISKLRFRSMWLLCDILNFTYNISKQEVRCKVNGWRAGKKIILNGMVSKIEIVDGLKHSIYVSRGKKSYSVGGKTARDEDIALEKIEILS